MTAHAIEQTRHWLQKVVVGLNLCPFAAPVLKDDSLRINCSDAGDEQGYLKAVLDELDRLQSSSEDELSTSLLLFTESLSDFDDYLEVVALAEQVVEEVGLDGVIQVASFHPDYCFEGEAEQDVSNYSNRSPLPMLHFIREAQISRLLANYREPESIPENNIRRLRELGLTGLQELLRSD